jgi:ATP-dependent DNA helicase RecG
MNKNQLITKLNDIEWEDSNSEFQALNNCSRNTASTELSLLVEKNLFKTSGQKGAGSFYVLK